jgi:hypothetical protein
MLTSLEIVAGVLIWCVVLWDGFATVVLPRTVAPMKRLSGRFYRRSWLVWAAAGRRIHSPELQLTYLAVYGPLSVMFLLLIWVGFLLFAFAIIYHGLAPRFQAAHGSVGFGALLYTSGSTFLTLGLGDITSADPVARFFMILEAGTGYTFLGLMISYMPVLHQAYAAREIENTLIHSRTGHPPSAVKVLHFYCGIERADVLRGNLRDAERWMAETLQSHLSHPVLTFYRAQHREQSWLVSMTILLDTAAVLLASADGLLKAQASITSRMGLRLLKDLTHAMAIEVDPTCSRRLTSSDMPGLRSALADAKLNLSLDESACTEVLQAVQRYDAYLSALSRWLLIPLPAWSSDFGRESTEREQP